MQYDTEVYKAAKELIDLIVPRGIGVMIFITYKEDDALHVDGGIYGMTRLEFKAALESLLREVSQAEVVH